VWRVTVTTIFIHGNSVSRSAGWAMCPSSVVAIVIDSTFNVQSVIVSHVIAAAIV
jgi:hypothetical protein